MAKARSKATGNDVIPIQAPAYGLPPYGYHNHRQLGIVYETDEESIRAVLPEPLEYVSNLCTLWMFYQGEVERPNYPFTTYPRSRLEAGVYVQARYKDLVRGHCCYMWVEPNADDSLMAGRELQGCPKKMADLTLREELLDDTVSFTVRRRGVDLIRVKTILTGEKLAVRPLRLHGGLLQIKSFPRIDGKGPEVRKLVLLENISFTTRAEKDGTVKELELGVLEEEPVYRLRPRKIYGCEFFVGSGRVENPSGREIANLLRPGR